MFDATSLIVEFHSHFLVQELFNATTIIYPQYWLLPQVEVTFPRHLAIIQTYLSTKRPSWVLLETLWDQY
jgi:hypothetical protein